MCMCTSERPADISALTAVNHLKLNLSKTELLFILGKDGPCISHCRGFHVLAVWNPGVIFNDGLSCTPNITAVARSCRFAIYSIHRIWSFLTKNAMQLLVQTLVISRLDYCNSLLAGLPASWLNCCNVSRRLQCTSFTIYPNSPCDLLWLPVVARIWFKMMILAFQVVSRTWPIFPKTLVRPHAPA